MQITNPYYVAGFQTNWSGRSWGPFLCPQRRAGNGCCSGSHRSVEGRYPIRSVLCRAGPGAYRTRCKSLSRRIRCRVPPRCALVILNEVKNQVISNTGFESPCSTKGENCRFSPLETPSALCPPQEAGFTLNLNVQVNFNGEILRYRSG